MTKKEALQLITLLQMAYPRQALGDKTVEVYAGFIQDLDYQVAKQVIQSHIRTEKWFPTIAEIREAYAETVNFIPSAEQAMEILRAAARCGNYEAVKQNNLLSQAVATVGFRTLCHSDYPEPLFDKVRDAYDNLRKREIKRLQASPNTGAKMIGASAGDKPALINREKEA